MSQMTPIPARADNAFICVIGVICGQVHSPLCGFISSDSDPRVWIIA
jgi:hypothetical protein